MSWQEIFIHIGNFLMLPIFMGCTVGAFARWVFYKHSSYPLLMLSGVLGSLAGLIIGWIITGHDGHTSGYILMLLLCTAFIVFTAGKIYPTPSQKRK